jgi:cytochrome c-type biogenesis protein CcmH/NrfG
MKNDSTTSFLNLVLAALVFLGVLFALLSIWRLHTLRQIQPHVQLQVQVFQNNLMRVQGLLNDSTVYNATAKSAELNQILQSLRPPNPPGSK